VLKLLEWSQIRNERFYNVLLVIYYKFWINKDQRGYIFIFSNATLIAAREQSHVSKVNAGHAIIIGGGFPNGCIMGLANEANAFFEKIRALLRVVSPMLPADRIPCDVSIGNTESCNLG
jgi:hypothetical protein